jgi:hypothetical protein
MTKTILGAIGIAFVCSVGIAAQWPKYQESGVPRDAKGGVRLDAPPPRTPDGKPDLSGTWQRADRDPVPAQLAALVRGNNQTAGGNNQPAGGDGRGGAPRAATEQPRPDPNSPPVAAFWDIGTNIPGGLPLTPWAAELKKQRMATNSVNNPDANCLPLGIHPLHTHPDPRKIVQTSKVIVIAWESNYGLRFIHTDGRTLPPQGEPQPWWYGYSVGRWDGDTLVVETNNVRGAELGPYDGWLDVNGSPHSEKVKFTERFRRPTFGKLEIDLTIDDAKAYTRPFTVRINQRLMADSELIEFICNENQQFRRRVKVD